MKTEQYIILAGFLLYMIFDGLRDYYVERKTSWIKWHLIKAAAQYPILGIIAFLNFELWQIPIIALCSWIVWHLSLRTFTPARWTPWIIKVLAIFFRMIFGIKNYYNGNKETENAD